MAAVLRHCPMMTVTIAAVLLPTPGSAVGSDLGADGGDADDRACGGSAAFCDQDPSTHFEHGVGYPKGGTGGPSLPTTSEQECCCACAQQGPQCNGWTLNLNEKTCYLKSAAGPATAVKGVGVVSGLMPPTPPPPPYHPPYPVPKGAKNILFLAVDDMRPSIGAYNFSIPGMKGSHTPNMDKLAAEGLLFTHAYVQYAYCSPSRNSFMSGRRPDTTKVWEFADHFREAGVGADWVSMPQFFKQHGYLTLGGGKLYHPASATENIGMPSNDYPASWTPEYPYFLPREQGFVCSSQGPTELPPGSRPATNSGNGTLPYAWCAIDTPKESAVLYDQQSRDACLAHLELATNGSANASAAAATAGGAGSAGLGRPFFVGCGFHKPHAPHHAPKEFFDMLPDYPEIPLPSNPTNLFAPAGMPEVAWHPYADVSGMVEDPVFNGTVNLTRLRMYRRGYYAAISYQDYNIGRIVDKLETVGHRDDTVVIVFGDHGYQLGDHATWAKMTNFELGVHIPLIVRAPFMKNAVGRETAVLAEMVDIFPTLAALAGLPDPYTIPGADTINGTSLLPVFADPTDIAGKTAAFSQFAKNNVGTGVAPKFFRNATELMGYTIRTAEWRYTAWFRFDNEGARGPLETGNFFGKVLVDEGLGRELYDHRGDTGKYLDWEGENVNLVNQTEHSDAVKVLHQRLLDYIQIK